MSIILKAIDIWNNNRHKYVIIMKNIERLLKSAILIYIILVLCYISYKQSMLLLLTPLTVIVFLCIAKKLELYTHIIVLVTAIFFSILSNETIYLSIPLAASIPFIARRLSFSEETSILGSTSIATLKYMIIASPLLLIDLDIALPMTVTTIMTILISIASYIKLSKIYASIVSKPNDVVLGRNAFISIEIYTSFKCYICIRYGQHKKILLAKDREIIDIELESRYVGINFVDIVITVYDVWGFSSKIISRSMIEYRVVPLLFKTLDIVRKKLTVYSEYRDSIAPELEISVLDLGLGLAIPRKDLEAIEALRKLVHVVKIPYISIIIERFIEILEEVIHLSTGDRGVSKRNRYGEYIGSRNYVPGDFIKHIHWKKSIGIGFMIVKEFGRETPEKLKNLSSRSMEPIIIVDLYATNSLELDRILSSLIRLCLSLLEISPELRFILILSISGTIISIRGKAIDIMFKLYKVFKELPMQILYSYNPVKVDEKNIEEILKMSIKPRLVSMYIASNTDYAEKLLKLLIANGVMPPKIFTAIYSDSLVTRYSIIKNIFISHGYIYTSLDSIAIKTI